MRRDVALALALLAALGVDAAQAADNIVPVEVRQLCRSSKCNKLFVEVTVCNAAQQCRTVPNVLVDTGSPGLRLRRDALGGLDLDAVRTLDQRPLGNWSHFGAGELWGTLHWAQVRIGHLATTEAIPIELFDRPSPEEILPDGYGGVDMRDKLNRAAGNGILGISSHRRSPEGYFVFVASGGTGGSDDWVPVRLDKSLKLANPIVHFPAPYDNGSVISLPEVNWRRGQRAAQGWLGFGLGAPTAALFPAGSRVIAHEFDEHHRIPVTLAKRHVDVMVDSGTNVLALDLEHLGLARHRLFEHCYDPAVLTPIALAVRSAAGEVKLARPLYVGPADNVHKMFRGYAVLPTIALWPDPRKVVNARKKKKENVLGLPFFFSRTVATGLQGTVNPYVQQAPASIADVGAGHVPKSRHGFVAFTD